MQDDHRRAESHTETASDSVRNLKRRSCRNTQQKKLRTLATQKKLDAFMHAKDVIDRTVQSRTRKEEESKHKDIRVKELNTNQLQTNKREHSKKKT